MAGAISVLSFIWWDAQFYDGPISDTLVIRIGLAALLLLLFGATFTGMGNRRSHGSSPRSSRPACGMFSPN